MKIFMRVSIVVVIIAVIAAMFLFVFSNRGTEKIEKTEPVLSQSRPVVFALPGNPDTLDPHATSGTLTFQVIKSFYDTLAEVDAKGNIVPALAESWTITPDGKTWTFNLRPNVYFHNGDPFKAEDVKATFERILSPATASPKAADFGPITDINTPDDATVVFVFSAPFAPFLASVASGWGAILPASLIKAGHNFASQPVGTGPYTLIEWIRDSRIAMKKFDRYWMAGLPKVENVSFNIILEPSVAVQGLLSKQIDYVYGVSTDDIPQLEASSHITLEKSQGSTVLVMSMNTSAPGLDDLRLRQAVNMAIDKQMVLDVIYGGGIPTATFIDAANAYYKDFTSLYPYDPEKASSLVAQVGAAAQREFLMVLPQNYETHVRAGQVYADMLAKVGIKTRIQMVDWSTWLSDVFNAQTGGKFDFTVIGHTGKLDPDGALGGYGDPARYVRWTNPECLSLVNQAKIVTDPVERKKLYDRVLELMAREVPFMYLGTAYGTNACQNDITGVIQTPKLDSFDFRWMEFK
ncbi:MAG: ABC transporter substrate-binding protein [Treponema sp.]|jgi:peptide/nickel transport system substrate-binding protein|nr:ABC transporter substrate-binding protein [Treponema sp.]